MKTIRYEFLLNTNISLETYLNQNFSGWTHYRIINKSVDARKKSNIKILFTVEVYFSGESPKENLFPFQKLSYKGPPVVIVGAGPAGLFSALRLCESHIPVIVIEQGSETSQRIKKINRFWRYGELDPHDNVCFGEGGAGLFSDGKLITRIKSPHIPYVLQRLVDMGAPKEILYLSNPHVGSDKIRRLVPYLRKKIESLGGKFLFQTQLESLIIKENQIEGVKVYERTSKKSYKHYSPYVVLATGHSAHSIYEHLKDEKVALKGQSFAMGLRIEHPRTQINQIQYGNMWEHKELETANYKLTFKDLNNKVGVYSFCMCPGGYVLNTSTDLDKLVCNGMSNYKRNAPFSNSALVVSIDYEKNFGTSHFKGLKWREEIEKNFLNYVKNNKGFQQLPTQKLKDFLNHKMTSHLIKGSSISGQISAPLHELLPKMIYEPLINGIENFNRKMEGFISEEVLLYGLESRTSSAIRILRDAKNFESPSHKGLYPTGEGAGYAGGITSAACDGVRVAESILKIL